MCFLLKKYFWWLLRRVKNLRSRACKHYRKCDVIYRYLHIELIWCLLMVQYLQNNVIMKWTTRFIRFTGWIPLKYGSTTTPPIIAHCQEKNSDVKLCISHCDSQNLQYKMHLEFWPSHRRIFKTSLYYKTRLILETRRQFNLWKPLMYFVPGHVCIIGKLPRWTLHVYNLMLLLHYICYLEVILWWIRLHRLTPYTELHGI